mgnify:CR=1 FL=1
MGTVKNKIYQKEPEKFRQILYDSIPLRLEILGAIAVFLAYFDDIYSLIFKTYPYFLVIAQAVLIWIFGLWLVIHTSYNYYTKAKVVVHASELKAG